MTADASAMISIHNPADGSLVGTVRQQTREEVEAAIAAAAGAMPAWAALPAVARSHVLRRWAALMNDDIDRLSALLTAEQGKPLAEARVEIRNAADFVDWFAEEGRRAYGEIVPANAVGRRHIVLRQPVGVCGAITPWNFPAAMVTRKAAPALAVGCAMIVKPAPQTPLIAQAICDLAVAAGVPAGVLACVTGDAQVIGGTLMASPIVRKISFTGSTAVGKLLMQQGAATVKRLSLELGGHAALIVFDDADLDAAVAGTIASKFRNAGQTCVCANRIYVQDAMYDAFVDRLTRATAALAVGNGAGPGVDIGPLIDDRAIDKVERHVADARTRGARVLTGGARHALGGRFYLPTVLADVPRDALICREETFGPVAPVIRFDHEAEAVAMANDTPYGLAAYLFTTRLDRAWRVAEALQTGMVGINETVISSEAAPFGGVKESGYGREGSRLGIEEYLDVKCLTVGGL